MAAEDEDESPHVNTEETDEEVQDLCPAFDNDLDSKVDDFAIEEDDRIVMSHIILTPETLLTNQCPLRYTAATVFTTAAAFS
jgi:hypothetical protein